MMNREAALSLLKKYLKNENLLKHSLAVEAVMRKLAQRFKENEEKWALAGLLHDIDYEDTKDDPKEHSIKGAKLLEENGLDQEIVDAVKAHNEIHEVPRETLMAKSLYCVDPLTGLIVAATLVLPEKKIENLLAENVLNRFKEKAFARGANREVIKACEEINLSLEEFIKLGLEAMQRINKELGL